MSVRIYELAKELGLPNKDLVAKVRGLGIDVRNHMSAIQVEDAQRIKRALDKERAENRDEKRLSSTVIRRRSRVSAEPAPRPAPAEPVVAEAMRPVVSIPAPAEPAGFEPAEWQEHEQPEAPVADADLVAEPPTDPTPVESTPVGSAPVESTPGESTPGESTPGESTAGDPTPGDPTPGDPTPVDLTPGVDAAEEPPAAAVKSAPAEEPVEAAPAVEEAPPVEAPPAVEEISSVEAAAAAPAEAAPPAEEPPVEAAGASGVTAPEAAGDEAAAEPGPARQADESQMAAEPEIPAAPTKEASEVSTRAPTTEQAPAPARADVGPATPKYQIRYAPGFEPGGKYAKAPPGRYGQPVRPGGGPASARTGGATPADDQPMSAAEAARMMSPAKPKVVITDLDARRSGMRREVTRAELFKNRNYRQQRGRRKKQPARKGGRKTEITTPAEHKRVIRVSAAIGVGEMARQMGVKAAEVLKKLWGMGLTNIMINQSIDADTASLLATEFGYEVEDVTFNEEQILAAAEDRTEDLRNRAPVITVMGHVDHGKTSVLDVIRHSDVASGEAGGITQHIGAYRVETPQGEFVFLDTPGHEAFTHMRARGAQCTDVVVLIVAADDGVMPQTAEAIDHAKAAGVPIIVAINKIDIPNANPDRVRSELAERNLIPEDWGGDTQMVEVSAKTKEGIDDLLESLGAQAEMLELKANPGKPAAGTVIEAKLDRARGCMCTVLVQEGTLKVGDTVVSGEHVGKIRAMLDHRGKQVKEAPPSTPVEVLGLSGVPSAGDQLNVVADEKAARQVAEHRRKHARARELALTSGAKTYEQILGELQSGQAHELKLVVKADVHGSSEAIKESLLKLSTPKISVNVIATGVGGISEADVNLAKASGAVVLGFSVRPAGKAAQLAERETVEIQIYDVIYEMLDDVKGMMQGLLPKERKERFAGRAEVRETFTIPKVGVIAGCSVTDGKLVRGAHLRLIRDNVKLFDSRIRGLRRFKDDVKEVDKGYECGVGIEGNNDIQVGDVIEAYEIEEVVASLT